MCCHEKKIKNLHADNDSYSTENEELGLKSGTVLDENTLNTALALIKLAESKPTIETGRNHKDDLTLLEAGIWTKVPYTCRTCCRNNVSKSNQKCKEFERKIKDLRADNNIYSTENEELGLKSRTVLDENTQNVVSALIKLPELMPTDETGRNDKDEFAPLKGATYICMKCLRKNVSKSNGYLINKKCEECARKT